MESYAEKVRAKKVEVKATEKVKEKEMVKEGQSS